MGTALTTSSGLEPTEGTLTSASDALSVDEPSQEMVFWKPPQPCDLRHPRQFPPALVSSLGARGGQQRDPPGFVCFRLPAPEQCSVVTEALSP